MAEQVMPVVITYTNHRNETSERRILPRRIWYGSTAWHVTDQWLLNAYDLDKREHRDFAMFGITNWARD